MAEKRALFDLNSGHFLLVFGQFWKVWDNLKLFFEAQKTALFLDIIGVPPPVSGPSGKRPESVVFLDEMAIKSGGGRGRGAPPAFPLSGNDVILFVYQPESGCGAMKPIVLSMILCDYYYRDAHTGKSVLAGTFSSISSGGFPSKHGNCAIYVAMTDVAANGTAQLVFRKENGEFSMQLPPWQVKASDDRTSVVEIGGNINGLPLPEPGSYEFVLMWDNQEIATRRVTVAKINIDHPPQQPEAEAQQ